MDELLEVFNNREIAIGIWTLFALIILILTKPGRKFIKEVLPILFCQKFVIFYIIFLSYFGLVVYGLYSIEFWNVSFLKDTIFWILFVELPLFAKTIETAKDNHFFAKLIKENIALMAILEFLLNFWTFGLVVEIIIIPITIIIGLLSAIATRKKEYFSVKRLFDWVLLVFGVVVIINIGKHIIETPNEIISIVTLKEFLLPILLLILNLPIVYALALYNTYEQVFLRTKGNKVENAKIKRRIFRFAGLYLSKITAVRNHTAQTLMVSLTGIDMKINLDKIDAKRSVHVGENYMKRTRFYIIGCVFGLLACCIGIIWSNSYVELKEILSFNFTLDIARIKEIITYICSCGVAFFLAFLVYAMGLRKKKGEEISQVKKYSLYNFFYLIKRQQKILQEFPPIDAPKELFIQYITIAYEIKAECNKSKALFENLLNSWELEAIQGLESSAITLAFSIGIDDNNIIQYSPDDFKAYFEVKKSTAPQNENYNNFIYEVKKSIEKYTEQIEKCAEEFKPYL